AESEGAVQHLGSVADYVEIDQRHERALDAALGDLLQYVVVRSHEDAEAGLAFARERAAGRVGFFVAGESPADAVRALIADVQLASSREEAKTIARETGRTVATPDGEVYRGPQRVE